MCNPFARSAGICSIKISGVVSSPTTASCEAASYAPAGCAPVGCAPASRLRRHSAQTHTPTLRLCCPVFNLAVQLPNIDNYIFACWGIYTLQATGRGVDFFTIRHTVCIWSNRLWWFTRVLTNRSYEIDTLAFAQEGYTWGSSNMKACFAFVIATGACGDGKACITYTHICTAQIVELTIHTWMCCYKDSCIFELYIFNLNYRIRTRFSLGSLRLLFSSRHSVGSLRSAETKESSRP